jgi:hypothetical protein
MLCIIIHTKLESLLKVNQEDFLNWSTKMTWFSIVKGDNLFTHKQQHYFNFFLKATSSSFHMSLVSLGLEFSPFLQ